MSAPAAGIHEEDVVGKVYDARLARRLLEYVRPHGGLVGAAVALLMIDGLLQLVGPLLTRYVIDVALPAGDESAVIQAAALFAVSLVAAFAAQYGETVITGLLGQRVMRDLRAKIFAHVQRLSIAFFDRNPVGRLVTRITSDVEALNELFTAGVVAGLGDLFTLAAISVMMLIIDWQLALASFAAVPLVIGASALFRRAVRASYREIRTKLARINSFLQERLTGMRIVQLFGRERGRGEPVRRAEPRPPRLAPQVDRVLRALFPGDRTAHVRRAGEPDRGWRASGRGECAEHRDGGGVSPARPAVFPAAPGPVGQVQHVTAGDGVVGAFLGGFLGNMITGSGLNGFSLWSILLAVVGALLLLWIYRMATRTRTTTTV